MDFKFSTSFSSVVKPLVSEQKDIYLALASLSEIGEFIPEVNAEDNTDLLPIAFNACVVNRVNKNGDVIDSATASEICKNFINKPINVEHNRQHVVGVILTAGYSEFGSDNPLTEDQIKDRKEPFNITLGGVVWRIVNSNLSNIIENSNDPSSSDYLSVSASWELGYSDYDIVSLPENEKNIENATATISDPAEIDKIKADLRGFGGSGKTENGLYIYRKIKGKVLPLGIGLTANPAADVQGVSTQKPKTEEQAAQAAEEISQIIESNVIKERINMKITEASQITDESLTKISAASIRDFIDEQLKLASEKYTSEIKKKEDALTIAQEEIKTVKTDSEKLKTDLTSIKAELEKFVAEKEEAAKLEKFNSRMSGFDTDFDLTDEDRGILASDIKDLSDEAFDSYKKKMNVLMKSKAKKTEVAPATAQASKKVEAPKEEEVSATVVEDAIENGEKIKEVVSAGVVTPKETPYDKYKKAFTEEGFTFSK